MLTDDITITVKAGNGGDGKVSLKRNAQTAKGGPDGGNGGDGGSVYIQGVNDITALDQFRYKKVLNAEDGIPGGRNNLYGRRGEDLTLYFPLGTTITDENNVSIEINDTTRILIAKGGGGGRGNNEFKSALNQTPRYAEKGEKGVEKILHLSLRLIADIGLIGLPNAGKSSLLQALTNAKPKIGNYPFTTLEPNLGVFSKNGKNLILADIPGLIEGASKGRGLGITFLKHIEKTKLLLHCIDSTSSDILADFDTVRYEFKKYNTSLLEKQTIILLTKTDLISKEEVDKKKKLFSAKLKTLCVSIYYESSLEELKKIILNSSHPGA